MYWNSFTFRVVLITAVYELRKLWQKNQIWPAPLSSFTACHSRQDTALCATKFETTFPDSCYWIFWRVKFKTIMNRAVPLNSKSRRHGTVVVSSWLSRLYFIKIKSRFSVLKKISIVYFLFTRPSPTPPQ